MHILKPPVKVSSRKSTKKWRDHREKKNSQREGNEAEELRKVKALSNNYDLIYVYELTREKEPRGGRPEPEATSASEQAAVAAGVEAAEAAAVVAVDVAAAQDAPKPLEEEENSDIQGW